jgi:hypothetical protein
MVAPPSAELNVPGRELLFGILTASESNRGPSDCHLIVIEIESIIN